MRFATVGDVFAEQIAALYSAETQLVAALPRMAAAAGDERLREALAAHLEQTRAHVERLREIAQACGIAAAAQICEGMSGLLVEGEQVVRVPGAGPAKDVALAAAAQRVEHYEIAAYGAARAIAAGLGLAEARDLLERTLGEEVETEELLAEIVGSGGLLGNGAAAAGA
jgi:ferritin-like metal-binding protein YciE